MINNKKGESGFNIQGMIIGLLIIGLFFGILASTITILGGNYDTSGYNSSDINKYNKNANLSSTINEVRTSVDVVTVNPNIFDFFAGIFNVILTPFKFAYRTFTTLISMTADSSAALQLLPEVKDFIITAITVLVIIGIVLIKFYMNKEK